MWYYSPPSTFLVFFFSNHLFSWVISFIFKHPSFVVLANFFSNILILILLPRFLLLVWYISHIYWIISRIIPILDPIIREKWLILFLFTDVNVFDVLINILLWIIKGFVSVMLIALKKGAAFRICWYCMFAFKDGSAFLVIEIYNMQAVQNWISLYLYCFVIVFGFSIVSDI